MYFGTRFCKRNNIPFGVEGVVATLSSFLLSSLLLLLVQLFCARRFGVSMSGVQTFETKKKKLRTQIREQSKRLRKSNNDFEFGTENKWPFRTRQMKRENENVNKKKKKKHTARQLNRAIQTANQRKDGWTDNDNTTRTDDRGGGITLPRLYKEPLHCKSWYGFLFLHARRLTTNACLHQSVPPTLCRYNNTFDNVKTRYFILILCNTVLYLVRYRILYLIYYNFVHGAF